MKGWLPVSRLNINQSMTYNGSDTGQYGSYLTALSRINDAPIAGNNSGKS